MIKCVKAPCFPESSTAGLSTLIEQYLPKIDLEEEIQKDNQKQVSEVVKPKSSYKKFIFIGAIALILYLVRA